MNTAPEAALREAVESYVDPYLGLELRATGALRGLELDGERLAIALTLGFPARRYRDELAAAIEQRVRPLAGKRRIAVDVDWKIAAHAVQGSLRPIQGIRNIIAVASGKGGVGKSTVAVNIAVALARTGAQVGLLDADVYGPSIPLMMGTHDRPIMKDNRIIPIEAHGVKLMSIGFILDPEKALIWRGPLVAQLITQFLNDVDWGDLDYLIIDLPPGTGDAQLTLVQRIPISGAVIVTTPQDVALADALKGLKMFEEVKTPILGIVENMSGFVCPVCGTNHDIFDTGGGERIAKEHDVELLGKIPLEPLVRVGGDNGLPIVVANPDTATAKAFDQAAARVATRLAVDAAKKPRKPTIMLKTVNS
jgi:ATP-binding protein involved in chromosome partitioning